jgi:hypothetical protein
VEPEQIGKMKPMKYISIIAAGLAGLILFSCDAEISPVQSESFIKLMGSYGLDRARGIAVLSSGGYAICGTSYESDSLSQSKMVLMVTDKFGNMEAGFPKYYTEGTLSAGANAIVAKNGGNNGFLLCGYIEDESGDRDIYLVKTSPGGNISWTKSYGSPEDESVLHATEGITYEFMLAGYQEKQGEKDIMIMGLDQDGDSIRLSLNYSKPVNSKDASANYILNTGENYLCVCTFNKVIGEGTDILVLNFDDELSPNDEILSGQFDEYGKCIVEDDLDSYIVLGNRNNAQTGNSEILLHLIETDGLLVKESSLLATISERDSDLYAERLVKTEAGRYAIVGTRTVGNDEDIFIQFLQDYQVGERIVLGSTGDQSGADIGIPENGGLIILGDNYYEGNSMISLIKTDDSGNF